MIDICALCLEEDELKVSHIIPKFVWRWLKKTSPTKGMRTNRAPNLRVQDGAKKPLLCGQCEQRLSDWEKPFSEQIFIPLHDPEPVTRLIEYRGWALKFAVSVSWRVLLFYKHEDGYTHFTPLQHQLADEALEIWRKFLLGEVNAPGAFSQHLLPVDVIVNDQNLSISPFLNRYFLRNVHMDVISTQNSAYVYTKMGRLILFGRIQEGRPKGWKGMQLRLHRGDIRPRKYLLPASIAEYMNRKADEAKTILEGLSTKQQDIVDAEFYKNVDAIANSETFRAMSYDLAHSGENAFSKRKRNKQVND